MQRELFLPWVQVEIANEISCTAAYTINQWVSLLYPLGGTLGRSLA